MPEPTQDYSKDIAGMITDSDYEILKKLMNLSTDLPLFEKEYVESQHTDANIQQLNSGDLAFKTQKQREEIDELLKSLTPDVRGLFVRMAIRFSQDISKKYPDIPLMKM